MKVPFQQKLVLGFTSLCLGIAKGYRANSDESLSNRVSPVIPLS